MSHYYQGVNRIARCQESRKKLLKDVESSGDVAWLEFSEQYLRLVGTSSTAKCTLMITVHVVLLLLFLVHKVVATVHDTVITSPCTNSNSS